MENKSFFSLRRFLLGSESTWMVFEKSALDNTRKSIRLLKFWIERWTKMKTSFVLIPYSSGGFCEFVCWSHALAENI
ncbi:unnamed protein product [Caenorhabditis nigoni]